MTSWLVPLLSSFLSNELLNGYFYPLFAVYFIAAVPIIIRDLTRWR